MTRVSGRWVLSAILKFEAHYSNEVSFLHRVLARKIAPELTAQEIKPVRSFSALSWSSSFENSCHSRVPRLALVKWGESQCFKRWSAVARTLDETRAGPLLESKNAEQQSNSKESGAELAGAYPCEDLEYRERGMWENFVTECKILIAWPWQRVKRGSVLKLKLSGSVTEQLPKPFSRGLSLPVICQNLIKAAHDPRVAGVVLRIEPIACGWGKIDEICRHLEYFKKSGKFLIGFIVKAGEKEYYLACKCPEIYAPPGAYIAVLGLKVQGTFLGGVLEKAGVQPQVQAIGKYKSVGEEIAGKSMFEANREMLTSLLDDIYDNWVHGVSTSRGKTKEEVEGLLHEGIFEPPRLKDGGWITDVKYEDEVDKLVKQRLSIKEEKKLPTVDYKRYSRVKEWTLGLSGGGEKIAVIRAVGIISQAGGGLGNFGSEGISSDKLIETIRKARDEKKFKAVVLRIDSPGGDALASDLMWREIKLLAAKKPVVVSMADVAASGGYYMAMAAGVIVAESLTLTGSIGVAAIKFNLGQLYERIGFTKEIISRGRFAELLAEHRPFSSEEQEFFVSYAQSVYKSFRDKAALSRSMEIDKMEEFAQGRVWTGKAAAGRGLVDAVGGFWRAVAVAKAKAGMGSDQKVSLVELSRQQTSPLAVLRSGVSALFPLLELAGTENGRAFINFLVKVASLPSKITSNSTLAQMDDVSTSDSPSLDSKRGVQF